MNLSKQSNERKALLYAITYVAVAHVECLNLKWVNDMSILQKVIFIVFVTMCLAVSLCSTNGVWHCDIAPHLSAEKGQCVTIETF